MSSSEQFVASFQVYRPVTNLSGASTAAITERLDGYGYDAKDIASVLHPLAVARANILHAPELTRLHQRLKLEPDNHLEGLSDYVKQALSLCPDSLTVSADTLISQNARTPKKSPRRFLMVGSSQELLIERELAKAAVVNFFKENHGLKNMPQRVWYSDANSSGVKIANTSKSRHLPILARLEIILRENSALLPDLQLGQVFVG
jgi:hypothetical protein